MVEQELDVIDKRKKRSIQCKIVLRSANPRPLKGEYILRMLKVLTFS